MWRCRAENGDLPNRLPNGLVDDILVIPVIAAGLPGGPVVMNEEFTNKLLTLC
jgi:hypothetical protein